MSNTNANKNTPATSSTPTSPPAAAQAKPPANATLVSAGNGTPAPVPAAPPTSTPSTADSPANESDDQDKIQYFVVIGKIESFKDVSKAEAFLNGPDAPSNTECTVIYGKVSLANEYFIVTGALHPFKSFVKVTKYLKDHATLKEFTVIRGRIMVPETRVSLRS